MSLDVAVRPDVKNIPPVKLTGDASELEAKIAQVKAKLDELNARKVSPKIDLEIAQAEAQLAQLKVKLDELGTKTVTPKVTADIAATEAKIAILEERLRSLNAEKANPKVDLEIAAAEAKLAKLEAELAAVDGEHVTAHASVDDGGSTSKIGALMAAGVALGPAIIPVAAAVAAALAAIGTGAVAGIAGVVSLKLAFSGVGTAVKALDAASTEQGSKAASTAAQQISSANSVANAQDGVRSAVTGVADAQRSAGIANTQAAESTANAERSLSDAYIAAGIAGTAAAQAVANAQQGVEDAVRSAAMAVQNAIDAEAMAEQQLANAQQQEQIAQENLTAARQSAQRQLESLALQVRGGALAERQAQLSIESAKLALDRTLSNPAASVAQREQAQLTYDQAMLQLDTVRESNKNLAEDKAVADAKGVEGSTQVVAAQRQLASATQAVGNAQNAVGKAQAAITEAQRAGAESVAKAEQSLTNARAAQAETARASAEKIATAEQALSDARTKQAETARAGAESVVKAQEGVVRAQRALQDALAQQAAQAAATATAVTALQKALNNLSPAGQAFAHFVHDELQPKIKELQAVAQQGLLPGVEAGLRAVFPLMPQIKGLIGSVSLALGDMAKRTGEALNSPFWRGFISFIQGEAGPSLRIFGSVMGNLATAGAAMLMAFKPVWDQMGVGILNLTTRFAAFSQSMTSNVGFRNFLAYVKETGPLVLKTFGDLIVGFVRLGQALAPLGGVTLQLVDYLAQFLGWLSKVSPGMLEVLTATAGVVLVFGKLKSAMEPLGKLWTSLTGAGLAKAFEGAAASAGSLTTKLTGSAAAGDKVAAAGGKVGGALSKLGAALPVIGVALIAGDLLWGKYTTSLDDGTTAMLKGGDAAAQMKAKVDDQLTGFGKWVANATGWAATSENMTKAMKDQLAAMDPLTRAQTLATKAQNDYTYAVDKYGPASNQAREAQREFGVQTAEITRLQALEKTGLESVTDALKRQQDQVISASDADIAYKDSVAASTESLKAHGATLNIDTDAGRRNQSALNDQAKAAQAEEDAMKKNGATVDEVRIKHEQHRQELIQVATQMGLNTADAQALTDKYLAIPKTITTEMIASTVPAVTAVQKMATDITAAMATVKDQTVTVTFAGSINQQITNLAATIPHATGGPIFGPGTETSDTAQIARLSHNEHVWTAAEVRGAGGHAAVMRLRKQAAARQFIPGLAMGGTVAMNYGAAGQFATKATDQKYITDQIHEIIAKAKAKAAADAAAAAAAAAAGGPGTTGSLASAPGTEQWRGVGLQALSIAGQAAGNIGALLMQMGTESGGRTNAINKVDINWQHGTPSVGLMQVIGPTYQRWKDPAHDVGPFEYNVAEDPLSNILASIHYTVANYGSLAAGWKGHGYDNGGWLPPGLTLARNDTGQPERVLTGSQWDAMSHAATQGSEGQQPITIHVHPREDHSESAVADMVSRRLAFAMRSGA